MGWQPKPFLIFKFRLIRSEGGMIEEDDEEEGSHRSFQAPNTARVRVCIPLEPHGLPYFKNPLNSA